VPAQVIPSGLDFEVFRPIPRDDARRHLGLPLDQTLVLSPAALSGRASATRWRGRRWTSWPHAAAELVVAWGAPHEAIPY